MLGWDKGKQGLDLPPPGAALAGSPPGSEGSSGIPPGPKSRHESSSECVQFPNPLEFPFFFGTSARLSAKAQTGPALVL